MLRNYYSLYEKKSVHLNKQPVLVLRFCRLLVARYGRYVSTQGVSLDSPSFSFSYPEVKASKLFLCSFFYFRTTKLNWRNPKKHTVLYREIQISVFITAAPVCPPLVCTSISQSVSICPSKQATAWWRRRIKTKRSFELLAGWPMYVRTYEMRWSV